MHTLEVAIGRDGAGWRAQALQIDHGCEGNSPEEARLTFRRTLEECVRLDREDEADRRRASTGPADPQEESTTR